MARTAEYERVALRVPRAVTICELMMLEVEVMSEITEDGKIELTWTSERAPVLQRSYIAI
jgi:hypothetical protein